jgi:hypothetical protein
MTPNDDPVRQAFEAYMCKRYERPRLARQQDGRYRTLTVQHAWVLWQAALSTFPQAAAAVPLISEIADAIARNDIISGSPGPLYSMGWSDANKHAARFIRERFGITPPEGASE